MPRMYNSDIAPQYGLSISILRDFMSEKQIERLLKRYVKARNERALPKPCGHKCLKHK